MYDHYLFLTRLTAELKKKINGYTLQDAFTQAKSELVLQFNNNFDNVSVIFNFNTLPPIFYIRNNFNKAHKNVISVFKSLYGLKLEDVLIDNYERNIRFCFDQYCLVFSYRSKYTNVYLITKENEIIGSFKKNDKFLGKNLNEEFHDKELDFSIYEDVDKFNELMLQFTEKNKNKYHHILNSVILIEVLARSRNETSRSYLSLFTELLEQLKTGDLFIYESFDISIGKFFSKKESFIIEEDFFSGVRTSYYEKLKLLGLKSIKLTIDKSIDDKINKIRSKLANLKSDFVLEDKSEYYRFCGNIIVQNTDVIKKGDAVFSFFDKDTKSKVEISLNRAKNANENAELYFEKARDERNRLIATEELISTLEKNFADLEATKEIVRTSTSIGELKHIKEQFRPVKKQPKKVKKEIDFSRLFLQFKVFGDYMVYVGKDSKTNDILTTKFAKKDDIWLHVKGAVGSHCLIKKIKNHMVPKEAIQEAASIAAFYSKARTSEFVPVSYTEKKYVQKKKDTPQGSVFLMRERVLMVKPLLPTKIAKSENSELEN